MKINIVILFSICCMIFLVGCKKRNQDNLIPNVSVNETVYLSNPSSFNLQVQGGWIYHSGGYRGLIVYRRYYNFGVNDFVTYDLACPLHFADNCGKLEVVDDIYLSCPCSDHKYLLFDGLPLDESSEVLRQYNTQFDGGNIIQISN